MNLIFDFDGTICDSFDAAANIFKNKFPEYFTEEITPEMARNIGIKGLIKKTNFPKRLIPELMFKGSSEMAKKIPKLKVFPHMKKVIQKLSEKHALGIVTSNSEENVKLFLDNNNLNDCFDFIYSSPSLFGKNKTLLKVIKNYQIDQKDTIYIGDETRDIEAAKKIGIKSAAVTWGYEAESLLEKANPDIIVNSPDKLTKIIS
jgi:phosphoglycolate phosphatase-like HAD superfamily hydrolase